MSLYIIQENLPISSSNVALCTATKQFLLKLILSLKPCPEVARMYLISLPSFIFAANLVPEVNEFLAKFLVEFQDFIILV